MEPAPQSVGQQGRQQQPQPVYDIRNGGHYGKLNPKLLNARELSGGGQNPPESLEMPVLRD